MSPRRSIGFPRQWNASGVEGRQDSKDNGSVGWKWIFILEGLAPVVVSYFLYFLLPDKPETAKFLTKKERAFVVSRMALQTGSGVRHVTNSHKITWQYIGAGLADWKVWGAIIPFWACSIGTYAFTATVPTVVKDLATARQTHN